MLILSARVEGESDVSRLCFEAADLCNRLEIGLDIAFAGQTIKARAGDHPYNLIQQFNRNAKSVD